MYLVEFQTKYVWKIWLLGQVHIWKVNFQSDFPDTYLAEFQTKYKYVWKIRLLGQVRIWKVEFFLIDFPATYLVEFQAKYIWKI